MRRNAFLLAMFVVIHPTVICVISVSNLTSVADNAMDSTTKLTSSEDVIDPQDFVFLINNPKLCHQNNERVGLLVWVHSTPEHTRICTVLRETWATLLPTYIGKVKVVFFLGAVSDELLQSRLYTMKMSV